MKLVIFGCSLFLGGSIMFSASFIVGTVARYPILDLGAIVMIVGFIAAIAGMYLDDKKK